MNTEIECEVVEDLCAVRANWLDLQSRVPHRFFNSWTWLSCWLSTYDVPVYFLCASLDGKPVAMLALCRQRSKVLGLKWTTSLFLNQTGDPDKDQIWPEYNSVLVDPDLQSQAMHCLAQFMLKRFGSWDEFVVGMSTEAAIDELSKILSLPHLTLVQCSSYGVDLDKLRESNQSYLSSLSRNTRYQINRSIKLYEREGVLELYRAGSVDQALAFMREAAPIHIERWGEGLGGSGFLNPDFVAFHENLIRAAWAQGLIDIVCLRLNERPLAYLYNFIYQGVVYFYLGAIVRASSINLKPGLVAHALLIEAYKEQGYCYYDFMGGDDRYKRSLGSESGRLFKVAFRKKRAIYAIESTARKIKRAVMRSS